MLAAGHQGGIYTAGNASSSGDTNNSSASNLHEAQDKSYKICSVLGGLDVTRFVSRDARAFFAGAIEDVELIREVVGETTLNGGVGHRMTLNELSHSLDYRGRGINGSDAVKETTIEAGLGYVDDRPDRRMEFYVSLAGGLAENSTSSKNEVEAELAMVQAAALLFPWIVDRKSKTAYWYVSHENGRSEGQKKEPFRFNSLYSAAWIGSWGEAWAYYPPSNAKAGGLPTTLADVIGPFYQCHDCPFVLPNRPENNPEKRAYLTSPYADVAQTGLSLVSAIAPVYFTGTFRNHTYHDTWIASTGVDIEVSSVSSLLDDLRGRLTKGSFGLLVDLDLNVIVISQAVLEMIYPRLTGFEKERITYDVATGSVLVDRRNQTYLVSDTIVEGLTKLHNADWNSLKASLLALNPGERDISQLSITLTGTEDALDFYVMYERWEYVADWAILVFAPVAEVDNAMKIDIIATQNSTQRNDTASSSVVLEGEKGTLLVGEAAVVNSGTLDVVLTPRGTPSWLQVQSAIVDNQVLRAGESLPLSFNIQTNALEIGSTSALLSLNIQDDSYPDCFYNEERTLSISVHVLPLDCVRITGDNLRVSDALGTCVCKDTAIEVGGRCISYGVVLPLILTPLLAIGLILVHAHVERKKKQADAVWEVKSSELMYADPPEIAGRGTFGLVLIAEYRGTKVAVKRVIPPRTRYKDRSKNNGHANLETTRRRRSSLLNMIQGAPNSRRRRSSLLGVVMGSDDSETFQESSAHLSDTKFDFDIDEEEAGNRDGEKTDLLVADRCRNGRNETKSAGRRFSLPYETKPLIAKSRRRSSMGTVPGAHRRLSLTGTEKKQYSRTSGRFSLDHETKPLIVNSRRRSSMGIIPGSHRRLPLTGEQKAESWDGQEYAILGEHSGAQKRLSITDDRGSDGGGYGSMSTAGSSVSAVIAGCVSHNQAWGSNSALTAKHEELKSQFVKEMRHLSKLRHPCITTVMGAVISRWEEPLLVMEYMDHGSLYDLIHNETMIFEGEIVLPILRDVAQGLRFLHAASPQIIHGDIKSANILVDGKFRAKVADFGFTSSVKHKVGAAGTPYWMAPELLRRDTGNTPASDVYSFGIVLYEVFSRKSPYEGEDFETVIRDVCDPSINKRPPIPASMPAEVATLLYSTTLLRDAAARPSFQELDGFLKRFQAKNVNPLRQQMSRRLPNCSLGSNDEAARLLDEIFPPHVAAALREGRKVEPEHFDCVSIFFSDICGFTTLSSRMTPMKVSNMLDRLYSTFDDLSQKHGVHKLETIGDAWMGVANLFESCEHDHVKRVALFSIDVFGDAVNTAARMESNSMPGRIQCSERSFELLRAQAPEIPTECRGEIDVKGKGSLVTFWVGEGTSACAATVGGEGDVDNNVPQSILNAAQNSTSNKTSKPLDLRFPGVIGRCENESALLP